MARRVSFKNGRKIALRHSKVLSLRSIRRRKQGKAGAVL